MPTADAQSGPIARSIRDPIGRNPRNIEFAARNAQERGKLHTMIERDVETCHVRVGDRENPEERLSMKNGITDPRDPMTFPYLTTEIECPSM